MARNAELLPFEWLWRSLTYMRIQPFRKNQIHNDRNRTLDWSKTHVIIHKS